MCPLNSRGLGQSRGKRFATLFLTANPVRCPFCLFGENDEKNDAFIVGVKKQNNINVCLFKYIWPREINFKIVVKALWLLLRSYYNIEKVFVIFFIEFIKFAFQCC